MATGAGYKSKAGFRLHGFLSSATLQAFPTVLGTPTPPTLGEYDLIPFTKEQLSEEMGWALDQTLAGKSGFQEMNLISRMAGGSIELAAHYTGLNQLIAACMGWQQVRVTGALESPLYGRSGTGSSMSGTVTSSTGNTLTDSAASFQTANVGDWVRLGKLGTNANIYSQVRRITARNSATQITIGPDWTDNPVATTPYDIARHFIHWYEFSHNLHTEFLSDFLFGAWAGVNGQIIRYGVLGIDKGVAGWEWQACYVDSITFKLGTDGLTITAQLVPFGVDFRTTGRNSSAATWGYSPATFAVTRRILFADCEFAIGAYSSSGLGAGDVLGISDLEFTIKNNLQADLQTLVSGVRRAEPARSNFRDVTGSFTVPRYTSNARFANYAAGDILMAHLVCTGPVIIATEKATFSVYFRSLKFDKADAPVDGPGILSDKYTFRCIEPASPGTCGEGQAPSSGAGSSELQIVLIDSSPFNYFMGQDDSVY